MRRRPHIRPFLTPLALAALSLAVLASCDRTPGGAILDPPGLDGDNFVSAYSAIQVVGDFNGFDASVASMTLGSGGVWVDTLTVQVGCYLMKLRTNDDWDETPDFGRCSGTEGDCQIQVPADGTPLEEDVCEATGEGSALGQVEFLETGSYEFRFDEGNSRLAIARSVAGSISGTVEFEGVTPGEDLPEATVSVLAAGTANVATTATSSSLTGNYLVEGLPPGTYDLSILAPGYQEGRVEGVTVEAFETTTAPSVTLEEGCSSAFDVIRIVGDFNGWDTTVSSMTLVGTCLWADTLTINPAAPADTCTFLKFRTGEDWTANDYANCGTEDNTCGTPLSGSICQGSGTTDPPALGRIPLALGATYEVLVDEGAMTYEFRRLDVSGGTVEGAVGFSDSPSTLPPATVTLLDAGTTNEAASGASSTTDGTFSVFAAAGMYDVRFTAIGYLDSIIPGIAVEVDSTVDLGTVVLDAAAPGSISGFVAFDDGPGTLPVTQIVVTDLASGAPVDSVTSDPGDGSFTVPGLAATTYTVTASAANYAPATVDSVTVPAGADVGIGTLTLARLRRGSIGGIVTYSNDPTNPPAADIRVLEAGTQTIVKVGASLPADGSFQVDEIPVGTYDVRFLAEGYVDSLVTGVDVVDQVVTDLGTIQLGAEISQSMQVVGDFNGWDFDAPLMTLETDGTWSAIVQVPAGCHKLKFRTDGDWDATPDWGRCSGTVGDCQLQFQGAVLLERTCRDGVGLEAAIGEVEFPSTGNYRFQLDEEAGQFFVLFLGP